MRMSSVRSVLQLGKHYLVTTPIYYANSVPHVGHLYSTVLADAIARWKRVKGDFKEVSLCTGTDEHGAKIQRKAKKEGVDTQVYCDDISNKFRALFDQSDIAYTDFVRTTEHRHIKAVQTFWTHLHDRGFIYKSTYEGWYSVNDEAFLKKDQIETKLDPITNQPAKFSIESGHVLEHITESNYMFRLSHFKDQLTSYLSTGIIAPKKYQEVLHAQIENLEDLSISREASRVGWGVPVPNDSSQTVYVWMDALVNYITNCGYPDNMEKFGEKWPAQVHVVGKDIIRFHAIYWPSFLMAAGFQLPKKILCHGHWLINDTKMSKSIGNVIDPIQCLTKFGQDGVRYFLLREGVPDCDSNLSMDKFSMFADAELSNTLGNLYQRCLPFNAGKVYPGYGKIFESLDERDMRFLDVLDGLELECDGHYEDFNFYKGIQFIMSAVRACNLLVQEYAPWILAKSQNGESDQQKLHKLIFIVYETLRVSGILLQPIVPALSKDLLDRLGVHENERFSRHAKVNRDLKAINGKKLDNLKTTVLFKKSTSTKK